MTSTESAALRVRLSRLLFRWAKRLDPAWYYRSIGIIGGPAPAGVKARVERD